MTIDKYTKFILTLITIGIFGLNLHLFKEGFVKDAYANFGAVYKIAICNESGTRCASVHEESRNTNMLQINIKD